jgi:dTDP-4-dehydrorhamnose 3,5-epimerase-like enzyme
MSKPLLIKNKIFNDKGGFFTEIYLEKKINFKWIFKKKQNTKLVYHKKNIIKIIKYSHKISY